jgi:hypothetical protein
VERKESFWDINIGLGGLVKVPFPMETVFRNWLEFAEDQREFRHLVAIPYTFDNLFDLLATEKFQPDRFESTLLVPPGLDPSFPDFWHRFKAEK